VSAHIAAGGFQALFCAGAVCLLLTPAAVGAQPLEVGSHVRVTSEWYQLDEAIGSVQASTGDSLVVDLEGGSYGQALALDRIDAIELSAGTRRRTMRGLAIGSLVGVAIGLVIGISESDDPGGWVSGGESVALGVGLFGGTGALLGLGIGAMVRTETWRPVAF